MAAIERKGQLVNVVAGHGTFSSGTFVPRDICPADPGYERDICLGGQEGGPRRGPLAECPACPGASLTLCGLGCPAGYEAKFHSQRKDDT
jgi:hypothetical protein